MSTGKFELSCCLIIDVRMPVAIAKKAIVADTLKAVGKHVEQATGCQILVTFAPASNFVGLCRNVDRPIGPMSHMMHSRL
jgi:hypothetical protein